MVKMFYDADCNLSLLDGKASQRIVQAILHVFAGEEAVPDDFSR